MADVIRKMAEGHTVADIDGVIDEVAEARGEYDSLDDRIDSITGSSYSETVLYDTWNAFASNAEITLSDDAANYDALLIITSYHETTDGDYYYHFDSSIIPKAIVLLSISEAAQTGTYRGVFDIKGSFANMTYYMLWNAKFTANNKLASTAKYTGSFPTANCGIHKIIGIKY